MLKNITTNLIKKRYVHNFMENVFGKKNHLTYLVGMIMFSNKIVKRSKGRNNGRI